MRHGDLPIGGGIRSLSASSGSDGAGVGRDENVSETGDTSSAWESRRRLTGGSQLALPLPTPILLLLLPWAGGGGGVCDNDNGAAARGDEGWR